MLYPPPVTAHLSLQPPAGATSPCENDTLQGSHSLIRSNGYNGNTTGLPNDPHFLRHNLPDNVYCRIVIREDSAVQKHRRLNRTQRRNHSYMTRIPAFCYKRLGSLRYFQFTCPAGKFFSHASRLLLSKPWDQQSIRHIPARVWCLASIRVMYISNYWSTRECFTN